MLRRLLNSEAEALMSLPLFTEYQAVLGRLETQRRCPLTAMEQTQLLDAFLSRTRLVECITVGDRTCRTKVTITCWSWPLPRAMRRL